MLGEAKAAGRKLVMLTAYDAGFARCFDEAGADLLLVGDSLGMVVQG
ncbi:MAG TPA: 3-methyl-2-oxobutanoate hydroxymethyltransferase, partial [Xanthomonadaceae bacterium]|nr:3-methyl-2-oxobutanoate hydroxymethyltransferase [Xanthomonadaceae bacterium]